MLDYESLLADASQLPVGDRILLIEALWETVPETAISEQWLAEIQKRSAEFDSGSVTTIPWETIRKESLHRIARNVD